MNSYRRKPSAILSKIMDSITDEDRRHTRDRMMIAIKIADALDAKKLSQKRFAELMKKSESEISEWLSGNRNFTVDTLSDIENCLGINLLAGSSIRTRNVSTSESHIRIACTKSPRPYATSCERISLSMNGKWETFAITNMQSLA